MIPRHDIGPMRWKSKGRLTHKPTPELAGFIRPCAPSLVESPPTGPDWLHEIKFDGWRIIARKNGDNIKLWTRQAKDVTHRFARIARAVASLPIAAAVLDGEAVCTGPDQKNHFEGLQTTAGAAGAHLVAFEVLEQNGTDFRSTPIEERKVWLERLLFKGVDGIALSEVFSLSGFDVFEYARRMGLEGIVSKRVGSPYVSGPTNFWLLTKAKDYARTTLRRC
jgi:bifunctional non-homologous end joining protein LigD